MWSFSDTYKCGVVQARSRPISKQSLLAIDTSYPNRVVPFGALVIKYPSVSVSTQAPRQNLYAPPVRRGTTSHFTTYLYLTSLTPKGPGTETRIG